MTDEIIELARFGSRFKMVFGTDGLTDPSGETIPGGGIADIRLDRKQAEELKDKLYLFCDYVCKNCGKTGVVGGVCQGECKPLVGRNEPPVKMPDIAPHAKEAI